MKGKIAILALVALLCFPILSRSQAVVIDPSQIAASAVNAADQLDYMFDQLGELAHLGEQMNTMRDHINNVFGEDGIGGKTISILQDLGTLQRLTESYNSTMKMTEMYARQIKELEQFGLSDANMMLSYLNSMKTQVELAIETAKKILNTLGFSKMEKKQEVEKLIAEMEENLGNMQKVMEVEVQATVMAEGLNDFMDVVDNDLSTQEFVTAKQGYGTQKGAASGSLGVISLILGLLGIASCALGYHLFVSGGIAGDPTSEQVFIRIGEAFLAATVTINIIASLFHINL
jgi:enamine deaminase RidA (YjgF/YER057c/UK114 family)